MSARSFLIFPDIGEMGVELQFSVNSWRQEGDGPTSNLKVTSSMELRILTMSALTWNSTFSSLSTPAHQAFYT